MKARWRCVDLFEAKARWRRALGQAKWPRKTFGAYRGTNCPKTGAVTCARRYYRVTAEGARVSESRTGG